jgi:hypothetical protein
MAQEVKYLAIAVSSWFKAHSNASIKGFASILRLPPRR